MKKQNEKKDPGTIFNPVMYMCLILFVITLLIISFEYRRVCWLSDRMTDSMTDALLAAAVLDTEELRSYYNGLEAQIFHPEAKLKIFREILQEELGLDDAMYVKENGVPVLTGRITVEDFVIYSVSETDITVYDFDKNGKYTTNLQEGAAGILKAKNGEVVEDTALFAEISFTIDFMGVKLPAHKYHMVDINKEG